PAFVVGYREQESVVMEQLIRPLENGISITRIRPDLPLDPPNSLNDDALTALRKLKAGLSQE
ncbi:MAG: hypothetical protein HW403_801, partial [Dehalococcoidia bacterium]|nr:hypothetical protein [Dehalococcoidia bacterium]